MRTLRKRKRKRKKKRLNKLNAKREDKNESQWVTFKLIYEGWRDIWFQAEGMPAGRMMHRAFWDRWEG